MSLTPKYRHVILSLCLIGLAACSSTKSDNEEYVERPAEEIYQEAVAEMEGKNYRKAADLYNEVERQHPYSQWAIKSQIEAANAHYKALNYDDVILTLERFIQLHPANENIDYAYYLRALSYYEQISDVGRDQRMTTLAMESLQEVVRRFPDSPYARDAEYKLGLTRDHLAGKEMSVGRYYLKQGNYNAAINRFRNVVVEYQTTSHTAEALHRLVEAYLALGIQQEAVIAAAVLGHNYPGSEWYSDTYALMVEENFSREDLEKSWFSQAWDSTF